MFCLDSREELRHEQEAINRVAIWATCAGAGGNEILRRVDASYRYILETAREVGITMHIKRHYGGVKDHLSLREGVTHQGADDRGDWPWSTTGTSAIEHQPFDFEGSISCNQVHACATVANGPGSRCGRECFPQGCQRQARSSHRRYLSSKRWNRRYQTQTPMPRTVN